MQFCTVRRAEWKARPAPVPPSRATRRDALSPRLPYIVGRREETPLSLACALAHLAHRPPPLAVAHSAFCIDARCLLPTLTACCPRCGQAAGERYPVAEQGKVLGAEWKSLTDKDKDKYI